MYKDLQGILTVAACSQVWKRAKAIGPSGRSKAWGAHRSVLGSPYLKAEGSALMPGDGVQGENVEAGAALKKQN